MSVRQPGVPRRQITVSRRGRALAISLAIFVVLIQLLPRLNNVYTDWLWFSSVDATVVFRTELLTRLGLFVVGGLVVAAAALAGIVLAHRYRPVFLPPAGVPDPLERYRSALKPSWRGPVTWVPVAFGVLAGMITQTQWQQVLAFFHSTPFGSTDPEFGLDISFYAFKLPFWQLVVTLLLCSAVVAFATNLITHYLFGGIRPGAREGALTTAARVQLASIAALFMITQAVVYWLDRYQLLFRDNSTFTGAGYTDVNAVMPAKLFLFAVALVCAAALLSAIFLRDLRIPALAVVLMVISAIVVGYLWPLGVEQFSVKPNRANKEREYIARNIEATRAAYGIGDEQVTYLDNWGAAEPDAKEAAKDEATLSNIRVLDPNVLSPTFTQQQQLRNFYGFPETLAMDRYEIDGKLRDFVVAAREIDPDALQGNQLDWINRHTVYTHGNGFVAAPANRINEVAEDAGSDQGGLPVWQVSDLGTLDGEQDSLIDVEQPRIYFGPLIAQSDPDYAIVGTDGEAREYDTDTDKYTYTGSGGVDVGNWVNRTAYALKFAERNILLSSLIDSESNILYDRDPRDRVEKVAPWLTTDTTTYPAVVDGRIQWIVDGYTTLDTYPYAELSTLSDSTTDSTSARTGRIQPAERASYIRNSVKATVDAYDGTVTLYQFDESDPVLETWMKAFPGTVAPRSDIQPELMQHFRYPEDLFKVQRELLAKYHVDDPGQFFTNNAFWSVPSDPTVRSVTGLQTAPANQLAGGDTAEDVDGPAQPPYYVVAADPESGDASFQLISAFRGYERQFLSAHMSASSDPDNYGQITVRVQRPTEPLTLGPVQAQDTMSSSPAVSGERRLMEATAKITEGNLLALPLADDSVLYIEPLYTQRKDQETAFPKLLRVMAVYNGRVGYAPTVYEALKQVGIETDPNQTKTADTITAAEAVDQASEDDDVIVDPVGEDEKAASTDESDETSTPAAPPASPKDLEAAVSDLDAGLNRVREAQESGDLGKLGAALEDLQKAVDAYQKLSGG